MSAQAEGSGKRILQNGGWLLAPKTVGAVLSFVYLAMIARSLGVEQFGQFALMFSFAQAVAGIASFQTWQIIVRYGTQPLLEKRLEAIAKLVGLCLGLDVLAFLFGALLAAAGVAFFGARFGWDGDLQAQIFGLSLILLASSRLTAVGILRLFDDFKTAAFIDGLVPILRFFGVLLVYFGGPNALDYLIIWVLSEAIPMVVIWALILRRKSLPLGVIRLSELRSYVKEFSEFARYALWSSIGYSLRFMNQQIIVVAVGFFTTVTAAGFFRLGHQLGQVLARISDGISLAFFTEFARVDAAHGDKGAQPLIGKVLIITILSSAVLLLLLLLLGRPVLELAFGADYLPAFPFVLLLGAAAAVQIGAIALEPVLMARGFAGRVMVCNLVGALAMVAFLVILLPRYEALGAAMAVLGSAIVSAIAVVLAFRQTRKTT